MLGAAGEQLAVYNGVQVAFDSELQGTNRYVYMYLHSYISAGGQLVTLANGTKQFNIVDNLGSVRCIVSWDGTSVSTQAFDYKPFGDLQEAGEENRIGYFGEQRDKESNYFAMGFRLYDPEIGRFLAIDPLLDVQPSQTPYHYCFNNPTSFTDPTGLYPEKEKGDKVQAMEINSWYIGQQIQQLARDNEANMEAERLFSKWSARMFFAWSYGEYLNYKVNMSMLFGGGGGGDGDGVYVSSGEGGNRKGQNDSKNGTFAGSMKLKTPNSFNVNALYDVCGPAYTQMNKLQSENPNTEVGFFLVWDKKAKELTAEFYIGIDRNTWLNLNKKPEGMNLTDNQMVLGFTHAHISPNHFSPEDIIVISRFSRGEYSWTNVPYYSTNKDPNILGKMYFSLVYQGRVVDAFGWATTSPNKLSQLYENIGYLYYYSEAREFALKNLYKQYGARPWKRK